MATINTELSVRLRNGFMRVSHIFPSNGRFIAFRMGDSGTEVDVYDMPLDQMHMLVSSLPLADDFVCYPHHGDMRTREQALAEINRCIEEQNPAHAPTPLTAA